MKVLLVCAAGMSTSILMKKMAVHAREHEIEFEVEAVSANAAEESCEGADCVLVGPQIRHKKNDIQDAVGQIPVAVVDPLDYGSGNCEHIFAMIEKLIGA